MFESNIFYFQKTKICKMKALLEIYAHNQYNFNLLQFKIGVL